MLYNVLSVQRSLNNKERIAFSEVPPHFNNNYTYNPINQPPVCVQTDQTVLGTINLETSPVNVQLSKTDVNPVNLEEVDKYINEHVQTNYPVINQESQSSIHVNPCNMYDEVVLLKKGI